MLVAGLWKATCITMLHVDCGSEWNMGAHCAGFCMCLEEAGKSIRVMMMNGPFWLLIGFHTGSHLFSFNPFLLVPFYSTCCSGKHRKYFSMD